MFISELLTHIKQEYKQTKVFSPNTHYITTAFYFLNQKHCYTMESPAARRRLGLARLLVVPSPGGRLPSLACPDGLASAAG